MSSWARRKGTDSGQERVSSWLNKVPGYSGYRQKEARRDEDKRVREELAAEYGQITQRLADLQGELVRAHRFAEIGNVERLERALRLFTDRLRVATYGYGGLFADRPIDDRALAQIAAFDRALGDGVAELRQRVEALSTAIGGGGDLQGAIRAVQDQIDALNRRFDLRGQAIETGQVQEGPGVSDLFKPQESEQAHVASDLHFGDAVSISGADWLVEGRMEFHGGDTAWRQYLLRDASDESWLHVPPNTAEPMALLHVSPETAGEGQEVTIGGESYRQVAAGTASAEIISATGKATRQAQYRRFSADNGGVLFSYDWGNERQTLVGHALDPLEIQVYSKT